MSNLPPEGLPSKYPPPQLPPGPPPMTALGAGVNYVPLATPVMGAGRPSGLTVIAVLGIIIAGPGILFNLVLMMSWGTMQKINRMVAAGGAPAAAVVPATAPASGGGAGSAPAEFVATNGFSAAQRKIVLEGLNQAHPLSEERQALVDALLADAGQRMIRLAGNYLNARQVALYVNDSRTENDEGRMTDVLLFTTGALRVNDKRAEFMPAEGGGSFHVEGGRFVEGTDDHMDAIELGAIMDRVQKLSGKGMSTKQMMDLQSELNASDQGLVTAKPTPKEMADQVKSAKGDSEGTITIEFVTGETVLIDADGQTWTSSSTSGGGVSTFTYHTSNAVAWRGGMGGGGTPIPSWALPMVFIDALLSLLLAIWLLLTAILILRNGQVSRKMGIGYGIFKLILLFGGEMLVMFWVGQQMNGATGGFMAVRLMEVQSLVAIYAVALLVVMFRGNIREYYANPTAGRIYY